MNCKTKTKGKLLLVDDEANTLKVLSAILIKEGYEVDTSMSAEEAALIASKSGYDTILTDYRLPGMSGAWLIDKLKEADPNLPIIMLTAFGTINKAVDAMKRGAFSYLTKPVNPDELLSSVREAVGKRMLASENASLKEQLKERYCYKNILGKSGVMQDLFRLIETVAGSTTSILITGESGTGKELVAKAIHYASVRAERPFIPIDCAALPEQLLESELFGHEKGAFTGAFERKAGQAELADGGTLFLDEVGELPLGLQKKFLRFLQEREFLRVGGRERIKVDARIIAATNRNLEEDIAAGNFRDDLYYRLNVVRIHIPSLRDRKEDIPLLAAHFLANFSTVNSRTFASFDSRTMKALMEYDWPGNIRELENAVERAVVLCPEENITINYLPRPLREVEQSACGIPGLNLPETEKRLIIKSLTQHSWNQTKAAEALGISRKQLRTKMKNHGLLSEDDQEQP